MHKTCVIKTKQILTKTKKIRKRKIIKYKYVKSFTIFLDYALLQRFYYSFFLFRYIFAIKMQMGEIVK